MTEETTPGVQEPAREGTDVPPHGQAKEDRRRASPRSAQEESPEKKPGRAIEFKDPEPWPEPVDGAVLLDEIAATLSRYIVLPVGAAEAIALWVAHTYALDTFDVSPLLLFSSPVKRSGKTTALRLVAGLVWRPWPSSGISPSAVFRVVEAYKPTLIVDEMDAAAGNEELRAVLNSGQTRDMASVTRNVRVGGDDFEPRMFSTWCPKALANIGKLPGTLEDRAVRISMRRKMAGDTHQRIRRRELETQLKPLRQRLARWSQDNLSAGAGANPEIPDELDDRAADNWEPLLAIADAAGKHWPERARRAAVTLSSERSADETEDNPSLLLLADLRELIESDQLDTEGGIEGAHACTLLNGLVERPWKNWSTDGLRPVNLARLLKPFNIKPGRTRAPGHQARRYALADFRDAFARYLGEESGESVTRVTPVADADPSHASPGCSTCMPGVTGVTALEGSDGSQSEMADALR